MTFSSGTMLIISFHPIVPQVCAHHCAGYIYYGTQYGSQVGVVAVHSSKVCRLSRSCIKRTRFNVVLVSGMNGV